MKKENLFVRILNRFEDLFLTNHSCISCLREIPDGSKLFMCDECRKSVEFLIGDLCPKCGDKLNVNGKCINNCHENKYSFNQNLSLFYYEGAVEKVVKNLKYGGNTYLAKYLADMMTPLIKDKNLDIITFVPMTNKRKRNRGFNQAELIAKALGKNLNIEKKDLLIKVKETIHQAGATQAQRMKNLKDSFDINSKYYGLMDGKNILIVDDVFTTGSTLSECAKTLKKLKPKKIFSLTFAKTKFELNQK